MGFAAFTFFVIFLLIASGGLLLFYRAAMLERISSVVTPRARQAGGLYGSLQRRVSVGASRYPDGRGSGTRLLNGTAVQPPSICSSFA